MTLPKEKDQKFFTLVFEEDGKEVTTKVPAKKGKVLGDAISEAFECNHFSIDSHSLFLEASNTPLPFNSDSFLYGGNSLYVRENEKMQIDRRVMSFTRADSVATGKKSPSSPEPSKSVSTGKKSPSSPEPSKRVSDILSSVTSPTNSVSDIPFEDDNVFSELDELHLEDSCEELIPNEEEIPLKKQIQQRAIWELFTTEVSYIKDVKVIIEVFQKGFKKLQSYGFLSEVNEDLIFANINEIYHVNMTFWRSLKETIDDAQKNKKPISPCQLMTAFGNFEALFQPYIQFCNADTSSMHLPDYAPSTNEMLKQYITWCDKHEACKRITIAGFLIKPLQRITKYSLLLKAILNKSEDEDERRCVEELMSRVETFVSKINSAIHLRQEQEKLNNAVMRLSDYYPLDCMNDEAEKIVKEYCNLDFKGRIPGLPSDEKRFILKEGPMKMVDKFLKKEVYAFLFSDVFVITKLKKNIDKYRINQQPYRLNKLIVHEMKDTSQLLFVYLNEYGVIANAFICQVNEQDKWKSAIDKAKMDYEIIREEYGLRENFLDDDLPTRKVSANKVLRRAAHVRKTKRQFPAIYEPQELTRTWQPEEMHYEWDMTLTLVALSMIYVLNIVVLRIMEYFA